MIDPRLFVKNWVANPSFEYGVAGYSAGWNATLPIQSAMWADQGTKSGQIQTNLMGVAGQNAIQVLGDAGLGNFPVVPGQQVSAAAVFNITARVGNALAYVQFNWVNASLGLISAVTGPPLNGGGIARSVIDGATVPAGAAFLQMYLVGNEGSPNPPAGQLTGFVDSVQLHLDTAVCPEYGDGDMPGWKWTGTPGNSSSIHPAMSSMGLRLYDAFGPVVRNDTVDLDLLGLGVAGALGAMFQDIDYILDPGDGTPPFAVLYDPDRCPASWLPWLAAQYGVILVQGATEQEWRDAIRTRPATKRGRPATHIAAIQATLTGTKHVDFNERDGSAYRIGVLTLASETPDPVLTLAAALSQVPGGDLLSYDAVASMSWADVVDEFDSWADLLAARATWTAVLTTLP